MGPWAWVVALVALAASVVAVQSDARSLEIGGSVAFVLLFGWLVVKLRAGAGTFRD